MSGHHFISYSSADGVAWAERIHRALETGTPPFPVWRYQPQVRPSDYWAAKVVEALRTCASLLFIMTPDSVEPSSKCENEWSRAMKYKKPVIPLLCHPEVEVPLCLETHQYIDFLGDFEPPMTELRRHLAWLQSPEGVLQRFKDRLRYAERALRRRPPIHEKKRIEEEIVHLEQAIRQQEQVVADPERAVREANERVQQAMAEETRWVVPAADTRQRFINPPPGVVPGHFQDRLGETRLIAEFLRDEARCLLTLVGRGGAGKTAMVCRLLKALETGRLPDGLGPHAVDGIVYLSAVGSRRLGLSAIFDDLCRLLPEDKAEELIGVYKNPQWSPTAKMHALLAAFDRGSTVLLLDNLEDLIDPRTREIRDRELNDALRALLTAPEHRVKVIITTRIAARSLLMVEPARQLKVELDQGLPSPYAENILRSMDVDGKLGLKTAPDALLAKARERTRGYPRALETLFAILSADRETTLEELLADEGLAMPDRVLETLVGEAYYRLDDDAQKVMQALAVFGRPVPPVAVDYLLQPHVTGLDSAPVLRRLVNMMFVRRQAGRYYLHPVDRDYCLARVPEGELSDRGAPDPPPFTRYALWHRGAEYFRRIWPPPNAWSSIDDLAPQRNEFDLRIAGHDYETAAALLVKIDMECLFPWGHYGLMIEMHEPLQDRLEDAALRIASAANLGSAYAKMGKLSAAIEHQEKARQLAHQIGDRQREIDLLNRLGLRYQDVGQTTRAMDLFQQSLALAAESGLVSLAAMMNLGRCHADRGEYATADELFQKVLNVVSQHGLRPLESNTLENVGHLKIDRDDLEGAVGAFGGAIRIADELHNAQIQNWARWGLALALLYRGRPGAAETVCEEARDYPVPENDHRVAALLGQLRLLNRRLDAASDLFDEAIRKCDDILANCDQVYHALDCRGLAQAGLALCGRESVRTAAIESFRAAREINRDRGAVARLVRQLEAFSPADPGELLSDVCKAAAGR